MEPQLSELQEYEIRKLYKKELLKLFAISMTFLVCAIACVSGKYYVELNEGIIFTSVLAILISGHWLIVHFNDYKDFRDPIGHDGCLLLDSYSQEYDAVNAYLKRINLQGRPVMYPDLWRVNSWRSQLKEMEKLVETQNACKRINGLS